MTAPILLATDGRTKPSTWEAIVRGINEPLKGIRKSIVRTASSASSSCCSSLARLKQRRCQYPKTQQTNESINIPSYNCSQVVTEKDIAECPVHISLGDEGQWQKQTEKDKSMFKSCYWCYTTYEQKGSYVNWSHCFTRPTGEKR